jgi:hypothetical protein
MRVLNSQIWKRWTHHELMLSTKRELFSWKEMFSKTNPLTNVIVTKLNMFITWQLGDITLMSHISCQFQHIAHEISYMMRLVEFSMKTRPWIKPHTVFLYRFSVGTDDNNYIHASHHLLNSLSYPSLVLYNQADEQIETTTLTKPLTFLLRLTKVLTSIQRKRQVFFENYCT